MSEQESIQPNLQQDDNEWPPLKRPKLELESTNSPSPVPQVLTSESRPEVQAQIAGFTSGSGYTTEPNGNFPAVVDMKSEPTETVNSPSNIPPTTTSDVSNPTTVTGTNTATFTSTKADLIRQSGRKVEDIIDGSDIRKFLNKTLTENIVKGLDEIVRLWENGEFKTESTVTTDTTDSNSELLKKAVVLKFADILKASVEN